MQVHSQESRWDSLCIMYLILSLELSATQQLGKNKFEELLGGHIMKPQGRPVLVPETDKRPVFSTAKADFEKE